MEITNSSTLQKAIIRLEQKRREQEQDISAHFKHTYQSLQPLNILKNTFHNVTSSPGIKGNLLKAGLGLGAGLLTKRLFFGGSGSAIKKIIGTAVEVGVTKAVTNKSGNIIASGLNLLKKVVGETRRNK